MNLITENKLNIEVFKEIFNTIQWVKLPRSLGPNHTEYFYSGSFSDEDKEIKILLRPTLKMSVTESFKNRMPTNGELPTESYRGPLVEWGFYVEVDVPQSLLNDVVAVSKKPPVKQKQSIEW